MIELIIGASACLAILGWYLNSKNKWDVIEDNVVDIGDQETVNQNHSQSIFVQRLPIFNNQQKIIGYQLLPKIVGALTNCSEENNFRILMSMISQYDFAKLCLDKKFYINAPASVLESKQLARLPAENTVLIVNAKQDSLITSCKHLKEQSYQFAILIQDSVEKDHLLLDIADYAIFDIRNKNENISDWVQAIRGKKLRTIVTHIENNTQFEHVKQFGINAFQGRYLSTPETLKTKQLASQTKPIIQYP